MTTKLPQLAIELSSLVSFGAEDLAMAAMIHAYYSDPNPNSACSRNNYDCCAAYWERASEDQQYLIWSHLGLTPDGLSQKDNDVPAFVLSKFESLYNDLMEWTKS